MRTRLARPFLVGNRPIFISFFSAIAHTGIFFRFALHLCLHCYSLASSHHSSIAVVPLHHWEVDLKMLQVYRSYFG